MPAIQGIRQPGVWEPAASAESPGVRTFAFSGQDLLSLCPPESAAAVPLKRSSLHRPPLQRPLRKKESAPPAQKIPLPAPLPDRKPEAHSFTGCNIQWSPSYKQPPDSDGPIPALPASKFSRTGHGYYTQSGMNFQQSEGKRKRKSGSQDE